MPVPNWISSPTQIVITCTANGYTLSARPQAPSNEHLVFETLAALTYYLTANLPPPAP